MFVGIGWEHVWFVRGQVGDVEAWTIVGEGAEDGFRVNVFQKTVRYGMVR